MPIVFICIIPRIAVRAACLRRGCLPSPSRVVRTRWWTTASADSGGIVHEPAQVDHEGEGGVYREPGFGQGDLGHRRGHLPRPAIDGRALDVVQRRADPRSAPCSRSA